jgi:hypothetical protein
MKNKVVGGVAANKRQRKRSIFLANILQKLVNILQS